MSSGLPSHGGKLYLRIDFFSRNAWIVIVLSSIAISFLAVCFYFLLRIYRETDAASLAEWEGSVVTIAILFANFFVPYIMVPKLFSYLSEETGRIVDIERKERVVGWAVIAWVTIEGVFTKIFLYLGAMVMKSPEIGAVSTFMTFGSGVLFVFLVLVFMRLIVRLEVM